MWHRLAQDYQSIEAIYKDEFPRLIGVRLHTIDLGRNGRFDLVLGFDPPNYPAQPPSKWISKGYNTVSISLRLIDILQADIKATGPYGHCDLSIEKEANHLSLKVKSANLQMSVAFEWLYINGIIAYKNSVV